MQGNGLISASYCYKLIGAESPYGMDVAFPLQPQFDQTKMSLWIPYASGVRRDGVGDRLRVEGIVTERHRLNPVVLFDHGKEVKLPIGLACPWDEERKAYDRSQYLNVIDPASQEARLECYFYQGKGGLESLPRTQEYDHALFCEQLYDMAVKNLLVGGSIGYQVLRALELAPDYERGTPKGLDLLSVLMLEGSLVVMPANMDTVRKTLCDGKACGKPLSPYLVKSLSPFAGKRKAQLAWDLKEYTEEFTIAESRIHNARTEARKFQMLLDFVGEAGHGEKRMRVTGHDRRTVEEFIGRWGRKDLEGQGKGLTEDILKLLKEHGWLSSVELASSLPTQPGEPTVEFALRRMREAGLIHSDFSGKKWNVKVLEAPKPHGSIPYASNTMDYQAGDKVAARSYIAYVNPSTGKTELFARSGDRLVLVEVTSGRPMTARRPDGVTATVSPAEVRKVKELDSAGGEVPSDLDRARKHDLITLPKGVQGTNCSNCKFVKEQGAGHVCGNPELEGIKVDEHNCCALWDAEGVIRAWEGQKHLGRTFAKSLEIRRKYRSSKGVRRRLKKSVPGSSLLHIREKDLAKVREELATRGLESKWLGTHTDGSHKLKVSGDDKAIDELARKYGQPMKRLKGTKSMPTHNTNGKALNGKRKDFDPAAEEAAVEHEEHEELEAEGEAGEHADEKYSAQVLRRMHQDAMILLEEYDEMRGPLEHEEIDGHLEQKLQALVEEIDELEELFSRHHPDAEPLEGSKDLEETETGEEVDSTREEVPSEEEAAQAMMEQKGLNLERIKVLRKSVKNAPRGKTKKAPPSKKKAMEEPKDPENAEEAVQPMEEEAGVQEGEKSFSLAPHHKAMVQGAHSHLKNLSETEALTDDHRFESYHHAKGLREAAEGATVGGAAGFAAGGPGGAAIGAAGGAAVGGMMGGDKDLPGHEAQEEPQPGEQWDGQDTHPHVKALHEAADYLEETARTPEFTDEHREKALHHYKALEPLAEEGGEEHKHEPGEIDEKALQELQATYQKMQESLAGVQKQMSKIAL